MMQSSVAMALAAVSGLCASVSAQVTLIDGPASAQVASAGRIAMGPVCTSADCTHSVMNNTAARDGAQQIIEAQTFWSLPAEQRETIAAKLTERGESVPTLKGPEIPAELAERAVPLTDEEFEAAWKRVAPFTTREAFERFSPIHQRMLMGFADHAGGENWVPVMPCFTPDVDRELIMAFEEIISYGISTINNYEGEINPNRFEQTSRWSNTALDPSGGGQGNPTILTYSFPPDGTFIPDGVGEGSGTNNLNAFMDGIYGDRNAWRALYDAIFDRWEELSGVTYVYEPNDDGASLFDNQGIAGVRGDLRMAGKAIDGNSNVLAYNFFPPSGDMVVDTADSFYTNTTSNSLRLRNTLAHEHGHGMGQLHTCPVTGSKLMEPFINLNFFGPQFDDILNAQRHYGDPLEPNDSSGQATDLGSFAAGESTTVDTVSLDDNNDVDVYRFTLSGAASVTVTLRPQGSQYQAGPQTQNCNEQQPYNPLVFLDPAISVLASNGSTVLSSSNSAGAGGDEQISIDLGAGTYYVRATGGSPNGDQIIAYELDVDTAFDGLSFIASALPTEFAPGVATTIDIDISPDGESLVGTPQLLYRTQGAGLYTTINMVNVGGITWEATLPAFSCGDEPDYFFTAAGSITGLATLPSTGSFETTVSDGTAVTFSDNGETNPGYTVSGNAGDGQWTLGVPVDNDRGDPAADYDGSGSCWLTDNNPNNENSDVDDGETILTSPPLDLTAGSSVNYAYWFNDVSNGEIQGGDSFRVQVSTNGGSSYTTVRTVTTAAGIWRTDTLVAGVDYTPGAAGQGRLRFIADDIGTQNVIEAGVDAIEVSTTTCTDPMTGCNGADLAAPLGTLNFADVQAFLSAFGSEDPAADLEAPFGTLNFADVQAFLSTFGGGC